MKATDKTGKLLAIKEVVDNDDLIAVTKEGLVIRQHVSDIRVMGRNTQGVRIMGLKEGDKIASIAKVAEEEGEVIEANGETPEAPQPDAVV